MRTSVISMIAAVATLTGVAMAQEVTYTSSSNIASGYALGELRAKVSNLPVVQSGFTVGSTVGT